MLRCMCCELNLKHLDEEQRDTVLAHFAAILNTKSNALVTEVGNYLHTLEKKGYDVTNYLLALRVVSK